MAKIYQLERVEPQRTVQTQQGSFTSQAVVLRELEGASKYDQRYVCDYVGGQDLATHTGKLVAAHIATRTSESNGRMFSNFMVREVVLLC